MCVQCSWLNKTKMISIQILNPEAMSAILGLVIQTLS
jgi:hypothetical protein